MISRKVAHNKGCRDGGKSPFRPVDVQAIQEYLARKNQWRDLCLFMIGIDTYLRSCDLVSLSVEKVTFSSGSVRDEFTVIQKKSRRKKPKGFWKRILYPMQEPEITAGKPVRVALSPETRFVTAEWIRQSGKARGDYLFTRLKGTGGAKPHITEGSLRDLIKDWVDAIGLPKEDFSGHSLRKTRIDPLLEACRALGKDDRVGTILLGHSDGRSIDHYKKQQEVSEALRISASINFHLSLEELKKRRLS